MTLIVNRLNPRNAFGPRRQSAALSALLSRLLLLCPLLAIPMQATHADEGMWLFNNPPRKVLERRHQFDATDPWLLRLQRSAVRFNDGGSGSFISAGGLVLTNHHVGAGAVQKLSSAEHDYLKDGFHAKSHADEMKAVDSELNVLQSIEDVTAQVNAAVKPEMTPPQAHEARRAAINTIEKKSLDETGFRSDVVTLYRGAAYHLYRYKRFTDVRLVFAPEQEIAFFGGDPDNFEYPRFDLDFCLFRVYENDEPAKIEYFLPISPTGLHEDELVFVAGHPGHTDRLDTVDHLEFIRDTSLPYSLERLFRREVLLTAFGARSQENARRAKDGLFSAQNSRKALMGQLAGLQDPATLARKRQEEQALNRRVAADPNLKKDTAGWDEVIAAIATWRRIYNEFDTLENQRALDSRLFGLARTIVRMTAEDAKPNTDRLPEYAESARASLEQRLYSRAPIYDDLEILKLSDALSVLIEKRSADDPLVVKILAGKSPADRAADLIQGTKLKDVAERKRLATGAAAAIETSTDPMIELARLVDPPARAVRKQYEDEVQEPLEQAYAKIAAARFAISGTETYPDATFTLRLAFGMVRGYIEQGRSIPPWTTLAGAYERSAEHHNQPPFRLPKCWLDHKDKLNLDTPMNFISTADIIGGNSGSPVVNRKGQWVGLIFDGNLDSLVLDFVYTDAKARALAVDSRAIVEALRKIYDADEIADEIEGRRPGRGE